MAKTWHQYGPKNLTLNIQNQDAKPQSGTSSISKAPNEGLKDMDVPCTLKKDAKPQSGTSSPHQSPKSGH